MGNALSRDVTWMDAAHGLGHQTVQVGEQPMGFVVDRLRSRVFVSNSEATPSACWPARRGSGGDDSGRVPASGAGHRRSCGRIYVATTEARA